MTTQRDELRGKLLAIGYVFADGVYQTTQGQTVDDLIRIVDQYTQRLVLEGKISELDALFPDTDSGFAGQVHEIVVSKRRTKLQFQLDKLNGDRES